jgi:hypothetical protein
MCGNCEVEAAMLPVGAVVPAGGHAPVGGHAPAGAVVPVGNAANDIRWQLIGAGAIGLFGAAAVVAVNRGRDARRNADWAEMLQNANNMCLQQKEQLENENSVLRGNVTMHLHENVQCWKARREGDQVALTQCLEDKRALNRHWATYHDNYNQTQTLLNK